MVLLMLLSYLLFGSEIPPDHIIYLQPRWKMINPKLKYAEIMILPPAKAAFLRQFLKVEDNIPQATPFYLNTKTFGLPDEKMKPMIITSPVEAIVFEKVEKRIENLQSKVKLSKGKKSIEYQKNIERLKLEGMKQIMEFKEREIEKVKKGGIR